MPYSGLGAGTFANPYQVTTLAQLYEMRDYATATFKLMNDIDASDTKSGANTQAWNGPGGWTGFSAANNFYLIGDNRKITGLYSRNVTGLTTVQHGLFTRLSGTNVYIENVDLEYEIDDPLTPVTYDKGGICATNEGSGRSITGCKVFLTVRGAAASKTGGITCVSVAGAQMSNNIGRVEVYSESAVVTEIGGIASRFAESGVLACQLTGTQTGQVYIKSDNASAVFSLIGGILGTGGGLATYRSGHGVRLCRANLAMDVKGQCTRIGGIVGYIRKAGLVKQCWSDGYIKTTANSCSEIGGIIGRSEDQLVDSVETWSNFRIDLSGTGHNLIGGICGSRVPNALTNVIRYSFARGPIILGSGSTNFSGVSPYVDIDNTSYWNGDSVGLVGDEVGFIGGSSVRLTDAQSQSLVNFPAFSGRDWYILGSSPYPVTGNPGYDPTLVIYSLNASINYELSSSHVRLSATSQKLVGTVTNTEDYSQIASARIEYTLNGGALQTVDFDPFANPMEVTLTDLDDDTAISFVAKVVRTDDTVFSSDLTTNDFIHFELIQADVSIVAPTDNIVFTDAGGALEANRVHGSVLAGNYIFGSTRAYGRIVRVNVADYSDRDVVQLTFEGSPITETIDEIVLCNGFIWGAAGSKLIRINPTTLDFDVTVIPNSDQDAPIGTSNDRYIFVSNETSVSKYDTNMMLGATILADVPGGLITNALVGTLTKTALNSNNTTDICHSWAADSEYLYLAYTTGTGVTRYGFDRVFETLKIRISDMTIVGRADHPQATDDMTQNATHLFYGIEATTRPEGTYGTEWGTFAVRKSDMRVTYLGKLHGVETNPFIPERKTAGSYASLIFGDVLVDMKLDKRSYLLDVSDVDDWSPSDPVGRRCLGVIEFDPAAANNNTPNELKIDENGYFHAFTWPGGTSPDAESGLIRFLPPDGFAFTGPPSIQSDPAELVSGLQYRLKGFILNQNGQPVTAAGFEYGIGPDPEAWTDTVSASVATNFNALATIDTSGVWYYRAFATNSLGTGYGEVLTVTGAGGVPTVGTPTAEVAGRDAALSSVITSIGGGAVTAQGFQYGTSADNLDQTVSGSLVGGEITAIITDLTAGTYYARAFATNAEGTGYSSVVSFVIATQYKIEGSVSDADGNPVSGAKVYAINNVTGALHQTTTDVSGAYSLEGLSGGVGYHVFSVHSTEGTPLRSIVKAYIAATETA